jgi:hypothetical protein
MPGWHGWCYIERNEVTSHPSWEHNMAIPKKLALFLLAALVVAGAYDALRNLPVRSGCNFYSECPTDGAKNAAE